MAFGAHKEVVWPDVISKAEEEGLVFVDFSRLEVMADHLQSHVLVSVGSVEDLIWDREAVRLGISKLEAGDIEIDHIEIVS